MAKNELPDDIDRRMAFLEKLFLEDCERWRKNDARWEKNDERWNKNDERWNKNEERWEKNDERWEKNDERWQKLHHALLEMLRRDRIQGERLDAAIKTLHRLMEKIG